MSVQVRNNVQVSMLFLHGFGCGPCASTASAHAIDAFLAATLG